MCDQGAFGAKWLVGARRCNIFLVGKYQSSDFKFNPKNSYKSNSINKIIKNLKKERMKVQGYKKFQQISKTKKKRGKQGPKTARRHSFLRDDLRESRC